jgi:hypothetical protein
MNEDMVKKQIEKVEKLRALVRLGLKEFGKATAERDEGFRELLEIEALPEPLLGENQQKIAFCVSIETYAYVEASSPKEAHDIVVRAINLDYTIDPDNGVDFKQYEMSVEDTETGRTWTDAEIFDEDEAEE